MNDLLQIIFRHFLASGVRRDKFRDLIFDKEEDGGWYIRLEGWPEEYHANLEMVSGAARLLDKIYRGTSNFVQVAVTTEENEERYDDIILTKESSSLTGGAYYKAVFKNGDVFEDTIWLCPVTLAVFGRYPKRFGVKILNSGYNLPPQKEKADILFCVGALSEEIIDNEKERIEKEKGKEAADEYKDRMLNQSSPEEYDKEIERILSITTDEDLLEQVASQRRRVMDFNRRHPESPILPNDPIFAK